MAITLNGSTGITDADGGTVLNTNDFSSQAQAQAGTNNTTVMTPLRAAEAITAQVGVANAVPVAAALNASGSAPIYACRAWVAFSGATGTIIGSGNVGSVTRNAAGTYTINFTTAMPDTNYCITGVSSGSSTGSTSISADGASGDFTRNTTSVRIYTVDASGNAAVDAVSVYVAVFR